MLTGTGYLVRHNVENGQQVSAGDLLFETLEGTFIPGTVNLDTVYTDQAGVIATVSTGAGMPVAAGDVLMDLYPDEGMWISASVSEEDIGRVRLGMAVQYLLPGMEDEDAPLSGTVEKVSMLSDADTTYGTTYTVSIIPDPSIPFITGSL